MQLKLSSNWAATKESLLHFDSAVQLCQTNTSAKALSAIWQRRRSMAGFKSPCQPVYLSYVCRSWKKLVQGDRTPWTRAASCAKRGKSELLSLQNFLRRQTTVTLISHPNCKFKNGGVHLTCILGVCTLSARASEDLQGSNAPLQHVRPPNQKGRFAFFQCLVSHKDLENLQPGLMISIKDQWVFHNVWPKLELCIEWASNDVRSKKISCCPGENGWNQDTNPQCWVERSFIDEWAASLDEAAPCKRSAEPALCRENQGCLLNAAQAIKCRDAWRPSSARTQCEWIQACCFVSRNNACLAQSCTSSILPVRSSVSRQNFWDAEVVFTGRRWLFTKIIISNIYNISMNNRSVFLCFSTVPPQELVLVLWRWWHFMRQTVFWDILLQLHGWNPFGMTFFPYSVTFAKGHNHSGVAREYVGTGTPTHSDPWEDAAYFTWILHRKCIANGIWWFYPPEMTMTCFNHASWQITATSSLESRISNYSSQITIKRLEERHGSESDWKAEKNVTQIENLRTILHKFADINEQEFDQTRTSNPDIHTKICFLELGSNYSFSNQTVQSWCEQTSVQTTLIYFLRILRGTLSFIQTHRIFTFVKEKVKRENNPLPISYSRPQMAIRSKTNTEASWNSSKKKEKNTHRRMFSGRNKTNKAIWTLHVEKNMQIWFHILYHYSSQFCKDLIRHI